MTPVPRVIGIDPGTVSIDACGLDDGRLFLDESMPTREALAKPARLIAWLEQWLPLDLVAGPSGYGLPLRRARDLSDKELRLAYLAGEGDGGIGGLRSLARALAASQLPVVFTPGVVHLPSVPAHRKINRVDMGTADKVCAAALAVRDHAARRKHTLSDTSLILLELGGAFSAAIAVEGGKIVDGVGGTSGPIGVAAAGALDGEVAFLARTVTKEMLFGGGAATVAGDATAAPESLATGDGPATRIARDALIEGAVKAVASLRVSAPSAREVVVSGRMARISRVRDAVARGLAVVAPDMTVHLLRGFATVAKQAAQGAALIADGLADGAEATLVSALEIADASGTVLDHLAFITPSAACERLGIVDA